MIQYVPIKRNNFGLINDLTRTLGEKGHKMASKVHSKRAEKIPLISLPPSLSLCERNSLNCCHDIKRNQEKTVKYHHIIMSRHGTKLKMNIFYIHFNLNCSLRSWHWIIIRWYVREYLPL